MRVNKILSFDEIQRDLIGVNENLYRVYSIDVNKRLGIERHLTRVKGDDELVSKSVIHSVAGLILLI